jgi:SNF2 family DNA or RNA helicase
LGEIVVRESGGSQVLQHINGSGGLSQEHFRVSSKALAIADASREGRFVSYKTLLKKHPDFELKQPLHDFQVSGLLYLYHAKRGILADATGLGKTVQCVALFQFLEQYTDEDNQWVIIVPPSVVYQWKDEFKKFTHLSVAVVNGDRQSRIPYYFSPNWQFLITTYQLLWRDWEMLHPLGIKNWVFDDAHFFKNHNTKTAGIVKDLTEDANRIILSTATPIQKTPMDIHSLMEALHVTYYFGSPIGFENHYCVVRTTTGYGKGGVKFRKKEFIKAKNTGELRRRLRPFCLKRTFKTVGHVLPKLTVQPVWLDMHKVQRDLYDHKRSDILEAHDKGILSRVKNKGYHHMRQICGGTRTAGSKQDISPKLDTIELFLVEKLSKGEKMVVYAYYKETVRTLVRRLEVLKNKGIYTGEWVTMTGDDKDMAHREHAKQEFTHNPNCRILIGTDAIQVGLNLQAARYMLMVDIIPNPKRMEQLVGRIRRMGGDTHVIVYPIMMRKSLEESIWRKTRFESCISDGVFDERSEIFSLTDREFIAMLQEY